MSLLVVGTVAFDSIITPFGKAEKVIGGAATYISWAASFYYRNIKLVSVIGEDWPNSELHLLRSRGVDTEGLQIKKGEKSFFWEGKYHNDMNSRDTLVTDLNVLANFDPILPDSYKQPQFVMLGNLTPDVQMRVLDQLESKPKLIVLDTMNFWMEVALPSLKEVLKRVDVLTINDEEARQLSGEHSLVKAAIAIKKMGPKYIVIKKGEHGALLFYKNSIFFAPALPLQDVVDPTGAGDTFAGGFIGYLAQSGNIQYNNMKRAMIYGSAMASFCVEDFSLSKLQTLTDAEIIERLEEFVKLTKFSIKA
ncbi:MAG: bifunctional hydroxymethylpyrimidine kinase/phosphomethylpyrimidine kinase [Saprospiraceae bacterium]|jgi:sugar/nucleoside kinase (ribokinase family)|nr:bifunctional hydroxymethylpyrimidine kinase/phosphomethylpyrimidine kinase [Saprospiraceae bacterium]